ncbi:MAG: glutamate racemase [Phycisphaeraceae bacterium]|nr:glutamate racemase [Phycisphaeraceae bacterium]
MRHDPRPIGIFDSGVGGLTVLRALRARMPQESFVYLGDTARLPYGTKSPETIQAYARQAAAALMSRNVKAIVIACNTASAHGLAALQCLPVPVMGVVEPGAAAACEASRSGRIAVLCTEATARSLAYEAAIRSIRPGARVTTIACPLLVAMAEEGWTDGPVPEAVVRRYIGHILHKSDSPDCFVLGCTHFPLLRRAIAAVVGPAWPLIDSGDAVARCVEAQLIDTGSSAAGRQGTVTLMVTDGPDRFARLAGPILGARLRERDVEVVDIGEVVDAAVIPAA